MATVRARACAVLGAAVGRRRDDAVRMVVVGPQRNRRLGARVHDGGDHRLLAGSAAAFGSGVQPRHLLLPGTGRAVARRLRPLRSRAGRQPELVAGQRQSDLDDHDRAVRACLHPCREIRHDARRRSRDRGHDGAAAVHAARAGPAHLGRTPAGPARRRQRCGRTVDLRSQPAGDHPSDGRRAQRDADGGADGRGYRPDIPAPPDHR